MTDFGNFINSFRRPAANQIGQVGTKLSIAGNGSDGGLAQESEKALGIASVSINSLFGKKNISESKEFDSASEASDDQSTATTSETPDKLSLQLAQDEMYQALESGLQDLIGLRTDATTKFNIVTETAAAVKGGRSSSSDLSQAITDYNETLSNAGLGSTYQIDSNATYDDIVDEENTISISFDDTDAAFVSLTNESKIALDSREREVENLIINSESQQASNEAVTNSSGDDLPQNQLREDIVGILVNSDVVKNPKRREQYSLLEDISSLLPTVDKSA